MVHLSSNTFERTILNVFCMLIECDDEVKIRGAFIAFENFFAFDWVSIRVHSLGSSKRCEAVQCCFLDTSPTTRTSFDDPPYPFKEIY